MNHHPSQSDPESAGDDQLLDAILRGHLQDSLTVKNDRIDRVMTAIDRDPDRETVETVDRMPAIALWRQRPLGRALAAGFLLATITGLALIVARPLPAHATVLQRAIERLTDGDLTYLVSVSTPPDGFVQNEGEGNRNQIDDRRLVRRNQGHQHPGRQALAWRLRPEGSQRDFRGRNLQRLDGAILHTRGDRSVLLIDVRDDQVLARGFDGSEYWNNFQAQEPARFGRKTDQAEPRLHAPKNYLRFITRDLAEQLQGLERRYDLSEPILVEDADGGPPLIRHEAVRRTKSRGSAENSKIPARIELWTDPETERIVLCRLDFPSDQKDQGVTSIEFRLESTSSLPAGVFDPETYPTVKPRRRPATPSRQSR